MVMRLFGVPLMLVAIAMPSQLQVQGSFQDLAGDLTARVTAMVNSDDVVHVTSASADADVQYVRDEVARMLARRGIRVTDRAEGAVLVTIGCSRNLRERACAAEVTKNAARETAIVARALDPSAPQTPALALEIQSIFGQRAAILDIAVAGDRLFVLDPFAVTAYRRSESTWNRLQSRPIAAPRVWPRDVRGRLHL
jgi:hypothetical protein